MVVAVKRPRVGKTEVVSVEFLVCLGHFLFGLFYFSVTLIQETVLSSRVRTFRLGNATPCCLQLQDPRLRPRSSYDGRVHTSATTSPLTFLLKQKYLLSQPPRLPPLHAMWLLVTGPRTSHAPNLRLWPHSPECWEWVRTWGTMSKSRFIGSHFKTT